MDVEVDASVLSEETAAALRAVTAVTALREGFYLAGGTALALQIGHRVSHDLDFFTTEPMERFEPRVQRALGGLRGRVTLREAGQVDLDIDGTKVSFIAYPFGLVHPLNENGTVRLAAPAEIGLMKAYALGRRISGRDYIDLYFLLRDGHSTLEQIRREGAAKFVLDGEEVFSYMGFARQLVDSADVPDWPEALSMVRDKAVSRQVIDDFCVAQVREGNGLD